MHRMPLTGAMETTEKRNAFNHVEDAEGQSLREIVIDPVAEKALVQKCDWRVVPILSVLFCAAFLDRINIGKLTFFFTSSVLETRLTS